MNDIRTIIAKEWVDVRQNKMVAYVILFVPLIMTAIPIVLLYIFRIAPISASDIEEMSSLLANPIFAGMDAREAMQSVFATNMMLLFLIMPLMVPVTIASYSIVGEKMTRSLEPLLATPITTTNLLLGKSLAAAIPGIAATWLCYLIFILAARLPATGAVSDRVFGVFIAPMWIVALLVLAPLLTVLAVSIGIIVSSRVNDPRAAEQLGSLVVLPFMALFLGTLSGLILLNTTTFWVTSAIIALLDIGLVYVGVKLFQRETILTRWK